MVFTVSIDVYLKAEVFDSINILLMSSVTSDSAEKWVDFESIGLCLVFM